MRDHLDQRGALPISGPSKIDDGTRVLVGGAVTHRQRPATAGGVTFLNLEDETGMLNVVCSQGLFFRSKRTIRSSPALLVRDILKNVDGPINLIADKVCQRQLNLGSGTGNRARSSIHPSTTRR
ncbi:hypothetical protein MOQ72_41285 [Saccharopolyspora sp. K220]|uniref:hypothetical protein n=1 Tax=Saccharopolyspora soli TaxID=2926618 RepID=UPI001F55F6FD|nr:hypothetical protein [Saccharopolyspora soli]MCI2423856.1 hypothetical protein [Saccharopolyspora soli]